MRSSLKQSLLGGPFAPSFALAFTLALTAPSIAQTGPSPNKPTRHIILLDISGSLRTRGYATKTGWTPAIPELLGKLTKVEDTVVRGPDQVVVCPFSDGVTDAKEHRTPVGPFSAPEFAGHISEVPYPGSGATDMPRALRLAAEQQDFSSWRSLIWLVTDNENNLNTNQSDQDFYRTLRDSPDYDHVLFFPLADPKVRPNDNLVMYLLAPTGQWERPEIDKVAQAVKQKTGFDGIMFRPLYTAPGASALDFSKELAVEGRQHSRVTQEGGTTVLHFKEGDKLDGQLKFKIRSRLKGWRLDKAHLEDAEVQMSVPSLYGSAAAGKDGQKSTWQITPKELTVLPQKETAEFFLLRLMGPGNQPLTLTRSTWEQLTSPFEDSLPPIKGKVSMKARVDVSAEQIKTDIPPELKSRLTAVQGLSDIEHFMVLQDDGTGAAKPERATSVKDIRWERQILIKIEADSTPALLLCGLTAMGVFGLLALSAYAFLFKSRLSIEGPGIEQEVALGYFMGSDLVCDNQGRGLFGVRSRFGQITVVPEPEYTVNGSLTAVPVRWEGDEYRLECGPEGKAQQIFWLRRQSRSTSNTSHGESAGL